MGYSPKLWGSQAWHFIHMVALSYPEKPTDEVKQKYYNFFESLGYNLPCPTCSYHYREKFKKNPPRLESKESLFEWTVDIHNSVNRDNGKPEITYAEAIEQIQKNARPTNDYIIYGVSLSVAIITMICLFGYSFRKK